MPSLALRLRSETRALHTSAERIAFMRTLLRGRMLLHAYVALRRNLHAIYAALEPALLHHALRPAIGTGTAACAVARVVAEGRPVSTVLHGLS